MQMIKDPAALWSYLTEVKNLKPYSVRTYFTRVGEFADFLVINNHLAGSNPVKDWIAGNANLFRGSYVPRKPTVSSVSDAMSAINQMTDQAARAKAIQLLATGMRYTESTTLDEHGEVLGKGRRRRAVPLAQRFKDHGFDLTYSSFYKKLKKVGLTPHMLRKICATQHVKNGAKEADLMAIFGWTTPAMAAVYVQAWQQDRLADKMMEEFT